MCSHTRFVCLLALFAGCTVAENREAAWLRYEPITEPDVLQTYKNLPATVAVFGNSPVIGTARQEMIGGIRSMLGRTLRTENRLPAESAVLLMTVADLKRALPFLSVPDQMPDDAFLLRTVKVKAESVLLITAPNDRGVLYGVFALLRRIAFHEPIDSLDEQQSPGASIRWTNEWDNLDGTIERGYGGRSIFFDGGNVLPDLNRAGQYARLLASIGINGCVINNVNTNPRILAPDFLPQLIRIADVFRPWGVRLAISVDFSSPKTVGQLDTFDPLDRKVIQWWRQKSDQLYSAVPDLAGILMKADSEGRVGPSFYHRSHADAANLIARALAPHKGVLIYRAFVYDHHLDWRNPKNDRARAAYDNFATLDGKFDDNVLIQVKYGPIDFQVREPVSPLLGALRHTNQTLELQITQEYTGQQRQLCFLLPLWKEVLDFDLHAANASPTRVKEIVSGSAFHRPTGGFVGVSNVGQDVTWLGSDLALANLYAFGRIAWNPDLSSATVVNEWTRLTFGNDPRVTHTIDVLQLRSWRVYEQYTGNLGVGGLTDITGSHYGPGIESSEYNGWGQWHRADERGIGMDRTVATGTGYTAQYASPQAEVYESLADCPDNLLLFMHHVLYGHVLHSGETVIQHFYNEHYAGAAEAQTFPQQWLRLRGRIDDERFTAVLKMLEYQAGYADFWRDAICNWFYRKSKIPDEKNRVGHHPDRVEAESMDLEGYTQESIQPWEDASQGAAVSCGAPRCTAATEFHGQAGWYDLRTQYFDQKNGSARFEIRVGNQLVDGWTADNSILNGRSYSDAITRRTTSQLPLRPGDTIRLIGIPDGSDKAILDYIEIRPAKIPF